MWRVLLAVRRPWLSLLQQHECDEFAVNMSPGKSTDRLAGPRRVSSSPLSQRPAWLSFGDPYFIPFSNDDNIYKIYRWSARSMFTPNEQRRDLMIIIIISRYNTIGSRIRDNYYSKIRTLKTAIHEHPYLCTHSMWKNAPDEPHSKRKNVMNIIINIIIEFDRNRGTIIDRILYVSIIHLYRNRETQQ